MLSFKAYYYRYGGHVSSTHETLEGAIAVIEYQEDMGECYADCVVDDNGIIVHDFDADKEVMGREQQKSRKGSEFSIE